jgi:hypothetical protein
MGRDPPPGGARARGPLQARALGPGRGRKAAGRQELRSTSCRRQKMPKPNLVTPEDFPHSGLAVFSHDRRSYPEVDIGSEPFLHVMYSAPTSLTEGQFAD